MCLMSCALTSGSTSISNLPISDCATSSSAACGHGKNQSTVQPLIRPGNMRARLRNLLPTGEKQSTRCRCERTRSRKKAHSLAAVGSSLGRSSSKA